MLFGGSIGFELLYRTGLGIGTEKGLRDHIYDHTGQERSSWFR